MRRHDLAIHVYTCTTMHIMKIVKTRKVGNSVVVTLPPELGYEAGVDVLIDRAPNGDLRIMPAARLHEVLRERARKLVEEDAEALAILKEHDRRADKPAHPAA